MISNKSIKIKPKKKKKPVVIENEEETEECPICYDKFKPSKIITTKCNHKFCKGCVKNFTKKKFHKFCPVLKAGFPKCPICRTFLDDYKNY
jgi:SUMO ligase MMS21 Smc5/6 complex component